MATQSTRRRSHETRVTLKKEKPFPKAVTGWPVQIASIKFIHRDGREAVFCISANVNQDDRCGPTDTPALHIYRASGPERAPVRVALRWHKKQ